MHLAHKVGDAKLAAQGAAVKAAAVAAEAAQGAAVVAVTAAAGAAAVVAVAAAVGAKAAPENLKLGVFSRKTRPNKWQPKSRADEQGQ